MRPSAATIIAVPATLAKLSQAATGYEEFTEDDATPVEPLSGTQYTLTIFEKPGYRGKATEINADQGVIFADYGLTAGSIKFRGNNACLVFPDVSDVANPAGSPFDDPIAGQRIMGNIRDTTAWGFPGGTPGSIKAYSREISQQLRKDNCAPEPLCSDPNASDEVKAKCPLLASCSDYVVQERDLTPAMMARRGVAASDGTSNGTTTSTPSVILGQFEVGKDGKTTTLSATSTKTTSTSTAKPTNTTSQSKTTAAATATSAPTSTSTEAATSTMPDNIFLVKTVGAINNATEVSTKTPSAGFTAATTSAGNTNASITLEAGVEPSNSVVSIFIAPVPLMKGNSTAVNGTVSGTDNGTTNGTTNAADTVILLPADVDVEETEEDDTESKSSGSPLWGKIKKWFGYTFGRHSDDDKAAGETTAEVDEVDEFEEVEAQDADDKDKDKDSRILGKLRLKKEDRRKLVKAQQAAEKVAAAAKAGSMVVDAAKAAIKWLEGIQ